MKSGFIILFIFFLIGCNHDDEPNKSGSRLTLSKIRAALATSLSENNLIVRVERSRPYLELYFESGDVLKIIDEWIIKITYDSSSWTATFYFHDYTIQKAHFIGSLEINREDVVLDPYLAAPLTALAFIKVPVKGKFTVSVIGKTGGGITMGKSFDHFGEDHQLPIIGLYEDYTNHVEFVFTNRNGRVRCSKMIQIKSSVIPAKPVLDIEILKNQLPEVYRGLYIISNLKIGFDQAGELRWYYNGEGSAFFGKLNNGNILISDASILSFSEVSMLGKVVKKYHVPNGFHHEIVEMPNGNLLAASYSPPGRPFEDVVVEISRNSGQVVRSWDFKAILDQDRVPLPNAQPGDWLHINALYFDEVDNSMVISGRNQCVVAKIDYATSTLKWILSNPNKWKESFIPFLLKPVNSQGSFIDVVNMDFWSYGQHAIHRLPNGNLLLYDNGDYRGYYDNPDVPANSYTRIVEYKINEEKRTVELDWYFDYNKSLFTKFTGYTQPLDDCRLIAYMWVSEQTPKIIEVDNNHHVIYEANINRGRASYYRTLKVDVLNGI